ncbi:MULTISPECIES: hypothetical protein [unclassified Nostoc]|uniref:hypothetical protein n=1 Tax=unclassified Nostoc TaxID=2593658 RepID=UPI002AD22C70|nr:hypothetical protein [Nostoc sp. DedQUE03]MDZ7971818.1 hypothetical protein [Nostoc sp. DedQUE03]MDZ8048999.1 hypothetical protein [Nostoc sp. DedQUE02]
MVTLTRTWNVEFEKKTLEELISKHAPHIPLTGEHASRPLETEEEKADFDQYWAAMDGDDFFSKHNYTFFKNLKSVNEVPQNATVTIANDVINNRHLAKVANAKMSANG